jgi:hypothetical protein
MAIKGISYSERNEYISKADPAQTREEGATVFYWTALSNNTVTEISDMQNTTQVQVAEDGTTVQQVNNNRMNARNRKAFREGVTGWDNFVDANGKVILCKREEVVEGGRKRTVVSEESMNAVPLEIVNEVGRHIYDECTLTEDTRKKLEASLLPFVNLSTSNAESATATPESKEDAKSPSSPNIGPTQQQEILKDAVPADRS